VYSTLEAKRRLALSRGARGSLLLPSVHDPAWKDWEYWVRQYFEETISLGYAVPRHIAMRLSPAAAERLLCGSGLDLAGLHRLEVHGELRGIRLGSRLRYRGSFLERDFVSTNVTAGIAGSDPELRDSWVLVSAHYDHLGIGPAEDGDAIYNGVVDNAIGVAATLEIARVLAALPVPPRRSILFVFTTAEEEGLLGAVHYTEHPRVPLARTVANVNVDGLAHLDLFSQVIGIGAELSDLQETLARVAGRLGLSAVAAPAVLADSEAFAYSDQAAFAEAGIPALLVNEGFEGGRLPAGAALERFLEWGRTRYHRPADDLGQPLDFVASQRHAELIADLVRELADRSEAPRWRPGARYAPARARAREGER
jgi:Zn-dependent M28 family amino/carboxypeptidase